MNQTLDIVLLLALPASGKSEVRKYLENVPVEQARRDFHLGATVQLDDYPYVHMMRSISKVLRAAGHAGVFFAAPDLPMLEPRDWGTLVELLNEDFADLATPLAAPPDSHAAWLCRRFDAARQRVGAAPELGTLPPPLRTRLHAAIETEARDLWQKKRAGIPADASALQGKTIVVEFARGGPTGSTPPLPAPLGYEYSLGRLSDAMLARACILYIWVTPEESRRKNRERARPGREGDASILHHGVPETVMLQDYGCDDMEYLVAHGRRPDTVCIRTRGKIFDVPVARFDNRVDKTSFLRAEPSQWSATDVRAVHAGLQEAFARLAAAR